jgi:NADH-quinone oxidoreductase subunit M
MNNLFFLLQNVFVLTIAFQLGFLPINLFSDVLINVLLFPLISFIFVIVNSSITNKFIYKYSLLFSGFSFILSLYIACLFNFEKNGFQDIIHFAFMPSFSFSLRLGVDGISLFFILLTNFFIFLCILSLSVDTPRLHEALLYLFFLQWSVIATFLLLDLIGFFLFFERTLIPIFFLVLLW